MFTGIIEQLGNIVAIQHEGTNRIFQVCSPFSHELKIDQSVAHNGVCLTVTAIEKDTHFVTAIDETLQKTNLGTWKVGTKVNLERCMPAYGRFDGHIVQGHVDQTGICTKIADENGSWRFYFAYEPQGYFTVQKGSVCINGVSLTVVDSKEGFFSVAIIPYTYEHTNFHQLHVGDIVNLEFDIIGKYIQAMFERSMQK